MAMAAENGQVVIITGAVGNLGNAVTEAFSGARRVLVDRSAQRLAQRYPPLVNAADTLLIGDVNLADEKDVRRIAAMTLERFGRIDALLNTVGGFTGGKPVHEEDLAVWDRMFEINVRTALLSCRAVIPQMIRQGTGAIVNVAARAALAGVGGLGAYCAAKSGVIRLTEAARRSGQLRAAGHHRYPAKSQGHAGSGFQQVGGARSYCPRDGIPGLGCGGCHYRCRSTGLRS